QSGETEAIQNLSGYNEIFPKLWRKRRVFSQEYEPS
ncbi:hypothetical protein Y032_0895g2917, partial [Ancylostoma ceylanicum]